MLRHLAVRDFRNFERLDVDVPAAGFAIVGENGHGKTNLLEAVSYLALLRSARGARDSDVIRFGAAAFHVRADTEWPSRFHTVSVAYERSTKKKKAVIDGVDQPRLSEALAALPSVSFSPFDVALVAGGPAERRRYLDVTLALSMPRYLHALQQFRGALRQRNAVLRELQRARTSHTAVQAAGLEVWEPMLVQYGAILAASRHHWCRRYSANFSVLCASIGERATVHLRYASVPAMAGGVASDDSAHSTVDVVDVQAEAAFADSYQRAFLEQRSNEVRRGMTLVGPHRDDLQLLLGARELRVFGSAGQQRSAAIALRMLELSTLRDAIGGTPLLLLDDPFAELDARRSSRILSLLEEGGVGQVLLAVPREEDIPAAFTRLDRRTMHNGTLS